MTCKVDGGSETIAPTIKWYHEGLPVVTSSRDPTSHRVQLPNGSLLLMRVETEGRRRRRERRTGDAGDFPVWDRRDNNGDRDDDDGEFVDDIGEYQCTATDPETGITVTSNKARIELAGECAAAPFSHS